MRQPPDLRDRKHLAGDVACAGDGDDPDGTVAILEVAAQIGKQLLGGLGRIEQHDRREPPPGQHVRVVLDDGAQHRVTRPQHQAVVQQVDRLGGVSDKDDCIGRAGTGERRHRRASRLVRPGRHLRCEAGSAVHARVPGKELDHRVSDGLHRRSARRHVEVDVRARLAAGELYLEVLADEAGEDRAGAAAGPAPAGRFGDHQAFEGTSNRPSSITLSTISAPR